MKTNEDHKLRLKKATGWFPAGEGFLKAMGLLSDGSFKLFVFLCIHADRNNATYNNSLRRLATAIGKSRHSVEAYAGELKAKGLCSVITSRVPYLGTTFRISEEYWPYQRGDNGIDAGNSYVDSVRRSFVALGCTHGRFGKSEERQAEDFQRRGIPLTVVQDAMLVGACRKFVSWLNSGPSEAISSLHYFESLIEEVRERPFAPGYREYMRLEVQKLSELWGNKKGSAKPSGGGYQNVEPPAIV